MTANRKLLLLCGLLAAAVSDVSALSQPGVGNFARYATDMYPGFDAEDGQVNPEKKEPKWFSWINGPNRDTPKEQFAYCEELLADGRDSKAAKHLDALVREWPSSPEAFRAQKLLAETYLEKLNDLEEAFSAYRYLLDFYSLQADSDGVTDKMYAIARQMRTDGKRIFFVRFNNTVDVRRAFESCVLRAPGAKWTPEAMLTIGELREEEGKCLEAIKVYENLRNLYAERPEAKTAATREADARMEVLRDFGYNRERCRDTVSFLMLAIGKCPIDDVQKIKDYLVEAKALLEEEAWKSASFYDSRTRTRRSAINAYERFLADHPEGAHAEEARARLDELKEKETEK